MNSFIDLNCDMGEGLENGPLLMALISSANIACGYHAGDIDTMKRTTELALQYQVAIGAHPGFNDRTNFGRVEMHLELNQIFDLVTEQIYALKKITDGLRTSLHHIKPHGALYNMAARNSSIAQTIAAAVQAIDANCILYGLSGSYLITEAKKLNLRTASETFADRSYQVDGSLTPRSLPGALIENTEDSLNQVLQMVLENTVTTQSGEIISIQADTICIHGDGKNAVKFAESIRNKFVENKITIQTV